MNEDIFLIIFIISVFILVFIGYSRTLIGKYSFFVNKTKTNELIFFRQYKGGSYSSTTMFNRIKLNKLISKFNKQISISDNVVILSKFNNLNYPFFDLDVQKDYDLFKKLYYANSYVIFRSSKDGLSENYWAIVDSPQEKIKDIFQDKNWKICNDANYVNMCINHKKLTIRGLYKDLDKKPTHINTHGKLSKNFKLFIDKVIIYYNKEGLELSVLKYKDPTMLIRYNRKIKMRILNDTKES